jgi:hypothetical protein
MFDDPLGTLSLQLPPAWAYDPRTSSLTKLVFQDWTAPERKIYINVSLSSDIVPHGSSDDQWDRAVRERIAASQTARIERRPGPVIWLELPGSETFPGHRVAWVRGARLDVLIEQHNVPSGGALATQELIEALRTLRVPANERMVKTRPQTDWNAAMNAADCALHSGNPAAAAQHFEEAREVAKCAWLHNLVSASYRDIAAALAEGEAALALARITGSVGCLYQATTTLRRCWRSSLELARSDWSLHNPSLRPNHHLIDYIDSLFKGALHLHGEFMGGTPPEDCGQASLMRAQLFLRKYDELKKSIDEGNIPWTAGSDLVVPAMEDAKTAMALAVDFFGIPYDDLPGSAKESLAGKGIEDEAAWKKRSREDEIQILDTLVLAGFAVSSVKLGKVNVSASAMKKNAVDAARRLVELAPSADRNRVLAEIIVGYAGSLAELGDLSNL